MMLLQHSRRITTYDYYTGMPDMYPNSAALVMPGYGPQHTIMQVKVNATTPTLAYDFNRLRSAFLHKADGSGVFDRSEPHYCRSGTYNGSYATDLQLTVGAIARSTQVLAAIVMRISDQGGDSSSLTP